MIYLRTVDRSDVEVLLRWENDPAVWAVGDTLEPYTRTQIEQFVHNQQAGFEACGQLRLMIVRTSDEGSGGSECSEATEGQVVGAVDLFDHVPEQHCASVGILIYDPAERRRGYAAGALAMLEHYAQRELGLRELRCRIARTNKASRALFRQAGFRRIGWRVSGSVREYRKMI